MFEWAATIAPERLDHQWRLHNLYFDNSPTDKALATLKRPIDRLLTDRQAQEWHRFYKAIMTSSRASSPRARRWPRGADGSCVRSGYIRVSPPIG
jgi:ribosomal protein S21